MVDAKLGQENWKQTFGQEVGQTRDDDDDEQGEQEGSVAHLLKDQRL